MNRSRATGYLKKNRRALALLEALLVTVIWSSSFVIVKFGLETLGPLTIAGLRYSLGAIALAPFLLLKRGERKRIPKNLWPRLVLIGVSSYTIGNGALFWGLKYIPATTGSFLMGLIPLLVMIGGVIFLKEIPTKWQGFGVFISLVGSAIFFSGGLRAGEPLGIAILAMGLVGFMAFSLLGRSIARERSLDTLVLTTVPLIIGGLITICIALIVEGIPQFTTRSLWVVAWLALVNTSLGYFFYNHALRDLTALEMNMVMNLTPLFTAFISWVLLGERLGLLQGLGLIVMIVGVILVQRGRKKVNLVNESPVIATSRLELIPLTIEQLRNFLEREDIFNREVGQASRGILTPNLRKAIQMKLLKLEKASFEDSTWITYWLIKVPPEGFGAGMIGFKGLPDQKGEVEIGYGIDPAYQNQGYTTEAVRGMINWAFVDSRCRRIIAPDTLRINLASNRVLEKVGMQIYAESPDTLSWCLEKEDQITNT